MVRVWVVCAALLAGLVVGVGGAAAASGPTGSFTLDNGATMTADGFVSIQYQAGGPSPISLVYVSSSSQTTSQGLLACGGQWPYGQTIATWSLTQAGCAPSTADGPKRVYAQFVDSQGNLSPVYQQSILLDTTGPVWTQNPHWGFHTPQAVSATSAKLDASWATTDLTTVTANAHLSTDAGATWMPAPVASPQASTFTVTAPYQTPLETKVSPADAVGNYSIPDTLTVSAYPQLFDQTASGSITWAGGWKLNTATGYIGGSDKSASKAGATATFTFSGKAVSFVTTTGPLRGAVNLTVDGTSLGSVDLYSAKAHKRQVVWSHTFPTNVNTIHTLTLTAAGTAGRPRIDVDAFLVAV